MNLETEALARDAALDNLAARRRELVEAARSLAVDIAKRRGRVTSTEVLDAMRERFDDLDSVDPRFMGCIFRRGWKRVGLQPWGSHKRPVSVWRLASPDFDDREGSWT